LCTTRSFGKAFPFHLYAGPSLLKRQGHRPPTFQPQHYPSQKFISRGVDGSAFATVADDLAESNSATHEDIHESDKTQHFQDNGDSFTENPTEINGTADGLIIDRLYTVPVDGFHIDQHIVGTEKHNENATTPLLFTREDVQRIEITNTNVTLPTALVLLDSTTYPTLSRARKAIRKKRICFSRRCSNNATVKDNIDPSSIDTETFQLGKVITRIYPGDTIGFQRRGGRDYYATQGEMYRPPSFEIPVIYEDDHMAIINKPAGIVLYRAQGGRGGGSNNHGHGRDTLLSALPHVLTPSNLPQDDVSLIEEGHVPLKRPHPVHRLDRPTSGLVVVAKTKCAAVHLSRQFEFRQAQKSYMAIVNGYPNVPESRQQQSEWNTIDFDLEGKSAITEWRVNRTVKSLAATDGILTLVEMKPRTGRYHQLRRHFAWVCGTPLVGDTTYDKGDSNDIRLRQRGLFLCSNGIEIQHPYYNSPSGQKEWSDAMTSEVLYKDKATGCIMVNARIDLPDKFNSFLFHENKRAEKFL